MNRRKVLDAVIVFLIAVVIILFINTLLTLKLGVAGMAIAELLLAFAAIGMVLLRKENIKERLSLKLPSIGSFFGAALLMIGANAWQSAASYIYVGIFGEVSTNDVVFLETFFAEVSPAVALICVALIPAVCEEVLFRGYLFDSFKTKKGTTWAIVITAILFSVIHFDLYKMLPILVMGWAFGYITAKTESILLPVIFHFLNNAMSLISFYNLDAIGNSEPTLVFSSNTYFWIAVAAIGLGAIPVYFGIGMLTGRRRRKGRNLLVILIGIAMFIIGAAGMAANELDNAYSGSYNKPIREDVTYTETFTLDKNTMAMVSAVAMVKELDCSIVITDQKGDVVYDYADSESAGILMLDKGKYKVTYTFDVEEESTVAHNVMVSVEVMTYAEYRYAEEEKVTV